MAIKDKESPGQKNLGTSISGWGRAVMLALNQLGFDGRQIFLDCGLDPDIQGKSHIRNPVAKMQHVWRIAEDLVQRQPLLVKAILDHLHASSFHALGFGLYASQSIGDMLSRLRNYAPVFSGSVAFVTESQGEEFRLIVRDLRPVKSRTPTHVICLFILKISRELLGPEFKPLRIEFPWSEDEFGEDFEELYRAPLVYESVQHSIVMRTSDVETRLPSANAPLANYQDKLCREYLNSFDNLEDITLRVKSRIKQVVETGIIEIEPIATSLNMSARTLQRRLLAQNSNFRTIVDQCRRELLAEYLPNEALNATQIAYLLGYNDLPSFSKNFKVWYGMTFSTYRELSQQKPTVTLNRLLSPTQ